MSTIRQLVFDWLFNASVQIGLFAILAAALSPFTAKAKAKSQHCFYLALLIVCLTAPLVNTLWQSSPRVVATGAQQQRTRETEHSNHFLWDWNGRYKIHRVIALSRSAKTALLILWQTAFLYQLIHFGRSIYRVRRLRRDALSISPSFVGMARAIEPCHFVILQSTAIDDPVTVGFFQSAIILPAKLIPVLDASDLKAILAHEYAHIRRNDFVVHLLCQMATLAVAWHPGIQYLMSKISQTRELACDEYATARLGKRILYARTLLRLASLCLEVPRADTMGLSFFNGDNLEDRIMKLTEKRTSLSRAGAIWLASATFLYSDRAR
jgi:beta-lactamase regulating signal transducer with metallopeptidase domain